MILAALITPEQKEQLESGENPGEVLEGLQLAGLNETAWNKADPSAFCVLVRPEKEGKSWQTHIEGSRVRKEQIIGIEPAGSLRRTNVLMNTSMIDEPWCFKVLRPWIEPSDRVCVLAMSFFDDTKNLSDWNRQYAKGQGIWYRSNTDVFFKYGLKEDQIEWVNYYTDSPEEMKQKIRRSSILMLPGGAPDLFMKRIREKKLKSLLKNYQGLVIGYSAGAMIQLDRYHITPDEDYPDYSMQSGLGMLTGFDVEVHFRKSRIQSESIEATMKANGLPIAALYEDGGLIVEADGTKHYFGRAEEYTPDLK